MPAAEASKCFPGIEEEQTGTFPLSGYEHGEDPPSAVLAVQQSGTYAGVAYGRTVWLQDSK